MLQYPSLDRSSKAPIGKTCIAFVKYDGSNLRWEWSPKKGWNKYGTRNHLFDESDSLFSQAIPIFHDQLADELEYRAKQIVKKVERITAFTEFLGPSSFAGTHNLVETKELKLFDVFLFKKGFVPPRQFVQVFGDLQQAAEIMYEGPLTKEFILDVQRGKYPVFEGVVAKGEDFSVKIKTHKYFELLREKFADSWTQYGE